MGLLSEGLTQLLIPLAALVGLAFALLQWFLVSRVKVSGSYGEGNGYKDKLIGEAEEGVDSLEVTIKVAEIQNAISIGKLSLSLSLFFDICALNPLLKMVMLKGI